MPRQYLRKVPDRTVVTAEQLEAAKQLISEGASKRKAALQVGLKESTLRKRLKIGSTATSMGRFTNTFSKVQEDEIYEYVKRNDDLYYGMTMVSLRKLIYEFADINKIPHRFNTSSKLAGRDWVYGFLKRYPQLKLRQPVPTSIARAMGFNKTQVLTFYDNLQKLYSKYNFAPSRIYNMDESGVNTVPKKIPKVISVKGKKLVGKIVSAERGQTITLVCSMSVTGNFVPPAFIFPRKRMQAHLLNNAPEGSIGMVSDSGFINTNLFIDYLRHFKDSVQPTKDNPVLLILDNHSSHISLAAINYCRDNGIHMLTLPPHSSHKIQPLDRGFFGPLKIKFAYECDKWLSHHPGRVIGQTEVAQLVNEAFKKAATLSNAASGFRTSGIWPLDRDIFSEEDFAASTVTDIYHTTNTEIIPIAETVVDTSSSHNSQPSVIPSPFIIPTLQDGTTETKSSSLMIFSQIDLVSPHNVTTPSILQDNSVIETRSASPSILSQDDLFSTPIPKSPEVTTIDNCLAPAIGSVASTSKEVIPLSSIQEFPKVTSQNRRKKGKKSIIATESPYKLELEQRKKEMEETIAKKKIRIDLKEKLKLKKTSMKATKNKRTKKKTDKDNKENDRQDYLCPLCGEKYIYPPNEDWIQCSVCETWWHEQCSNFEEGIFVCDNCSLE